MAKRKVRIIRIVGWIIGGIIALILLTSLVFYIRRDHIVDRVVDYLNEQQPGEVKMEKLYMIPFMNFPDLTLHLREVKYYEKELVSDTASLDPLLSLDEISVTLDLVKLIKGSIMVSEARLKDGFVHMIIYPDSVTNLENALGIRFGEPAEKDSSLEVSPLAIDLDKIEFLNVRARMDNQLSDEHVDLEVNQLESSFSLLNERILAEIELNVYINRVKYQIVNTQIDKSIKLKGGIIFDPLSKRLEVEPSSLNLSGLDFETWGHMDLLDPPRIDLAFTASNEGLDLLNFIFMGILDLNEIEQTGGGSIHLSGTVQGHLGGGDLPVISVNGEARELGFKIKPIGRDVTDISFGLFATNGSKSDLSEGRVEMQNFTARFPEGNINANVVATNIQSPELNIEVDCALDLEGLEEMFKTEKLSKLKGSVALMGELNGSVNKQSGNFLNDEGSLTAVLEDVSFVLNRDSLNHDSIKHVSGEIFLHDTVFEADNLSLEINENAFDIGFTSTNLLLYLLDYNRDVSAGISLASSFINPATLLGDTVISNSLGGEVRDLYISAETRIARADLDNLLKYDSMPRLELSLDSFAFALPLLAPISDTRAELSLGPDSIALHHFHGRIGDSSLDFSGNISNYTALSQPDSGGLVALDFSISSELLWVEDLFTFNGKFLLPEDYNREYLKDFRIAGSLEAPAAGLTNDSVSLDFGIDIIDLGWSLRYYPGSFKNFLLQMERKENLLTIENFQGSIGDNNIVLSASIENFTDTLMENIYGSIELYSDLLDFNQLLSYQQSELVTEAVAQDSTEVREPLRINEIDFPNIDFQVNIGELRYGKHTIYGMNGKFRSSKHKVLYFDRLATSPEGRGTLELNGQLNVADPKQYVLSAEMNLEGIDINDLNLELQFGDSLLAVREHFYGIVDARGLAEIFITPELKVDLPNSVAQFILRVNDGALINFTPLQAAGKFLDTKDLNNVRFATVRNSFTLIDSRIFMPTMNVESTLGQLLISGEQGLDNSYLYLVHVPPKLARQAVRSAMAEGEREDGEDQVTQMKRGDFLAITLWSDGKESEFKLGDRRNKYKK